MRYSDVAVKQTRVHFSTTLGLTTMKSKSCFRISSKAIFFIPQVLIYDSRMCACASLPIVHAPHVIIHVRYVDPRVDDINTAPPSPKECQFDMFGVFEPRKLGFICLVRALADRDRDDVARKMILLHHVQHDRVVEDYTPTDTTCTCHKKNTPSLIESRSVRICSARSVLPYSVGSVSNHLVMNDRRLHHA